MASTSFARLGDELWKAATSLEEIAGRMESFEHIYTRLQDEVEDAVHKGHPVNSRDTAALCTISMMRFMENKKIDELGARVYELAREAKDAAAVAADFDTRR